jgi:hypothetical protein
VAGFVHISEMIHAPLSADTTPEAEAVQFALFRQMSPWQKLLCARAATRSVMRLHRAGIAQRSPGIGPEALQRQVAESQLGTALAARVYGALPSA